MFGGSVASLAVLGDPDIALITLTELAEQMRRMSRAASLPVLVDADHGYGNALNVRRTIEELETAGAAGLTIEDTLLPQAVRAGRDAIDLAGGGRRQDEGGAGCAPRSLAGHHRPHRRGIGHLARRRDRARARPMRRPASTRCSSPASRARAELEAIAAATKLPIVLGGAPEDMSDPGYLAGQRVRIALQGHAPFAAATQAVYETLKALREGLPPKALKGLASGELTGRVTREAEVKARGREFLGLKK